MGTNNTVIAFTGGGTAGHVFPAFPVIDRLRRDGFDVVWIGSRSGMERSLVERVGIPYFGIPSGKLRRYFSLKNLTDLFLIFAGFLAAFGLLRRRRPAVLVSKGGFVTVPPVAAARVLGIRTLTHESDVDPGLATRLNLKLGARALLAYEDTRAYLAPSVRRHALVVGNPVRDALLAGNAEQGRRFAGLPPDDPRPLVLVLGGSQGAREVNDLITGCLDRLLEVAAVVHQTGPRNPSIPDRPGYLSRPFFQDELPHLLAAARLAVARSGAGSVWELAATATPAIFVPLRGATRGDQLLNAAAAEKTGMSVTLGAGDDSDTFLRMVVEIVQNADRLDAMGRAAAVYPAREAADRIVSAVKECL